jgi:signal transduction histidine kinase
MQDVKEQRFASDYSEALAEHLAQPSESTLQRARELGTLANSLGVLSHEIVAIHGLAMNTIVPPGRVNELADSVEFIKLALQTLDSEVRLRKAHLRRMAAHELRTPLTTLRLSLQVGLGRLEKGEPVDPSTLQKALVLVDRLAARINDLLAKPDDDLTNPPQATP